MTKPHEWAKKEAEWPRPQLKPFWTTAEGKKIQYRDLSGDHLKNIIKDGYRNENIRKEAKKRGFSVPELPVESMTYKELSMYLESFASCAIEGNSFAEDMLKAYRTNYALFLFKLNIFITRIKE